jgi:hypothetical protein
MTTDAEFNDAVKAWMRASNEELKGALAAMALAIAIQLVLTRR